MSFDWAQYSQVAAELADPGVIPTASIEARKRSSVSRAYYAAFCLTRNWLTTVVSDPTVRAERRGPSGNLHQTVPNKMRGCTNQAMIEIGEALVRMRQARNFADYDDVLPVGLTAEDLADDVLADAAIVITGIGAATRADFR
jgi:uncharacterized protein (UPF0332 family)